MEFELIEVKKLKSEANGVTSLSLRFEMFEDSVKYTIHAVVPWGITGFAAPQIGDTFNLERIDQAVNAVRPCSRTHIDEPVKDIIITGKKKHQGS